ncbi:MAG: hypothetical protein LC623_05165, partial [Halobacteriales archaeon]|nr:hypothetical protein [Halobacteriales archaeon]
SMPAVGKGEAHALVTLHPDDQRQPRSWQTPRLCSPSILLQDTGQDLWMGQLNFFVRLEGRSLEELVAQLYDRHGIEARLEPLAA